MLHTGDVVVADTVCIQDRAELLNQVTATKLHC